MNHKISARRPGNRDGTFGTEGMVTLGILPDVRDTRLIKGMLLSDNSILLSLIVETDPAFGQYGLARLTPDGKLDPSFPNGGLLIDYFKGTDAGEGGKLLRLADGRLLMLGANFEFHGSEPVPHLAMACYSSDYTLDKTFGGGGTGHLVIENQPGEICMTEASTSAQQADGKILICTTYEKSANRDETIGVVYRLLSDGTPDVTFNNTGRLNFTVQDPNASTALFACLPQDDGKIMVAGDAHLQPIRGTALIARLDEKGVLDRSFGRPTTPGYFTLGIDDRPTRFNDLISTDRGFVGVGQSGGKIDLDTEGMLAGITKDGLPDTAFNGGKPLLTKYHPEKNNAWQSGYIQLDGKLLVTAARHYIYVSRFHGDGSIDNEFGTDGYISEDTSNAGPAVILTGRPENKILWAGNPTGPEGGLGTLFAYLG